VLPTKEVAEWAFNFYVNNYSKEFIKYFPNSANISFNEFVTYLCNRYEFKTKNGILDKERAMEYFLTLVKEGAICKVNYEK
jgi:hypothetical protein